MQTTVRHNRTVVVNPDVKLWRARMKRYKALKREITQLLQSKGYDKAKASLWLNTSVKELGDRTPKQCLNPRSITTLHKWCLKALA